MGGCIGKQSAEVESRHEAYKREMAECDRALDSARMLFENDVNENPNAPGNEFDVYQEIVIDQAGIIKRVRHNENHRFNGGWLHSRLGATFWDGVGVILRGGEFMDYTNVETHIASLSRRSDNISKMRYKRLPVESAKNSIPAQRDHFYPIYTTLVPVFENPGNKKMISHFVAFERVDFSTTTGVLKKIEEQKRSNVSDEANAESEITPIKYD